MRKLVVVFSGLALVTCCVTSCAKFEPEEQPEPQPAAEKRAAPKEEVKAPPTEPTKVAINFDCATLLTTADVKKVCGGKFVLTTSAADPNYPDRCIVRGGGGGKRMYFEAMVHPYEDAAKGASKGVAPSEVKLEESGEKSMKSQTAYARKGNVTLALSNQLMGGQKGVCSMKKLGALLKLAHSRLP